MGLEDMILKSAVLYMAIVLKLLRKSPILTFYAQIPPVCNLYILLIFIYRFVRTHNNVRNKNPPIIYRV